MTKGCGPWRPFPSRIVSGSRILVSPTRARPVCRNRPNSNAAASAVNALVLFEPGTSPLQAQRIVAAAGARIVGAPTETGAFKLAIAPGRQDAVLRALEENASVVMAEPIGGDRR